MVVVVVVVITLLHCVCLLSHWFPWKLENMPELKELHYSPVYIATPTIITANQITQHLPYYMMSNEIVVLPVAMVAYMQTLTVSLLVHCEM